MAEEIKGASLVVPRSIMISAALNGALGFAILLTVLFFVGNIDEALNSPTTFPFMSIIHQATQSTGGTAIMASIVVVMEICAVMAGLASSSRMFWAFCRDRAVPGWKFFIKVIGPISSTPLRF